MHFKCYSLLSFEGDVSREGALTAWSTGSETWRPAAGWSPPPVTLGPSTACFSEAQSLHAPPGLPSLHPRSQRYWASSNPDTPRKVGPAKGMQGAGFK